jgi:hypothetical protein
MVETDENRTRIFRVQTGCSPVELQPRNVDSATPNPHREERQRRAAGIPLDSLQRGGPARAARFDTARSASDEPRGVGPRRIHFGGAGRRVPPRKTERLPRIALGSRAWHARVLLLDHGRMVEPPSGLAPEPAVYETAARLLELQGHLAPTRDQRAPTPLLQRKDSNPHLSQ